MDTSYLLNVLAMLHRKPLMVVKMMLNDIESYPSTDTSVPWSKDNGDVLTESLTNITSMSAEEINEYVMSSPLGKEMQTILASRGVNVANYLHIAQITE